MKKLMIAIAATAFAVGANAATVKWSTDYSIADGTSTGTTSASLVYLIDASTLTQSSIYDSVCGGKTLAQAIDGNSIASASLSDGMISDQSLTIDATGSKTYYMVLFDNKLGDNGALYFSDQATRALSSVGVAGFAFSSDSSVNAVAANMTGFNASEGGWVAVGGSSPVPEPTSAMLLMLGLCGLALKRKNA